MTLDEMYSFSDSVWELTNPAMASLKQYVRVEIDSNGVCHQLNPAGERDGVLSREGWSPDTYVLWRVK